MQFLKLDQAHLQPYHTEYRYSPAKAILGFGILAAIACAFGYGGYRAYQESAIIGVIVCVWCGLWFALFAKLAFNIVRARARKSNWLVRVQTAGLLIKYRSYQNSHLPEADRVVMSISFSELAWARQHRLRRDLPNQPSSNDETRFTTYAELKLSDGADVEALRDHLFAERQSMPEWRKQWYGRTRGLSRHYPVTLTRDNIVRLEWLVRPSLKEFLKEISSKVDTVESSKSRVDYRHIGELSKPEQENLLLELIEGGDVMGAVRVIKKLYGYKTTEARRFLDELSARGK